MHVFILVHFRLDTESHPIHPEMIEGAVHVRHFISQFLSGIGTENPARLLGEGVMSQLIEGCGCYC